MEPQISGGQPGGRTEAESEPSHGQPEGRTQGLSRSGGYQEAEQKDRAGLGDGQQGEQSCRTAWENEF